jgi:hypothetical protein
MLQRAKNRYRRRTTKQGGWMKIRGYWVEYVVIDGRKVWVGRIA